MSKERLFLRYQVKVSPSTVHYPASVYVSDLLTIVKYFEKTWDLNPRTQVIFCFMLAAIRVQSIKSS